MDLSCPQCGLQLPMQGPRHEYCPDCLAERGQPVPLLASSLFDLDREERELRGEETTAGKAANAAAAMRSRHAF